MNTKLMCLGLALSTPLLAADSSKILLSGTSVNVEEAKVTGSAKAVVGEMTVTGDVIAFEKEKNVLRCEGAITIRVSGNVVTTRDCAIELGAGEKKLYFLSRTSIQISAPLDPRYFPAAPTDLIGRGSDRDTMIQDFKSRTEPEKAPQRVP